jgi:hypothetical protein
MTSIRTDIEIAAPASAVWAVLTDTAAYPDWNPFLRRVEGDLVAGARLRVRFAPPGGREVTMRPRLLTVDAPHSLRWLGRLGVPGLFDGEHAFTVEPLTADRVRFVQSEDFRGILVPLTRSLLTRTRAGFEAMNAALRTRAEARANVGA